MVFMTEPESVRLRQSIIVKYYKCKLCKGEVPSANRIFHLRNSHNLDVKKKWRGYYEG